MSALRIFDKFAKLLDVNWGSIADGNMLKRSGSTIIGATGGAGDVVGPASSVDGEVALFSDTTGKAVKRATGTGIVFVTNGVYQTPYSTLPYANMPPGSILQVVSAEYLANVNLTGPLIPFDDTKPQITEGEEIVNCVITPRFTNSKILVTWCGMASMDQVGNFATALFRDTGPDALAAYATNCPVVNGTYSSIVGPLVDSPATTSAVTYRIRVGRQTAAPILRFNGATTLRFFGGVSRTVLMLQEIRA